MIIHNPGRFALEGVEDRVVTYSTPYADGTSDYHAFNINQVLRGFSNAKSVKLSYAFGHKLITSYYPNNGVHVYVFSGDVYVQEQPNGLIWSSLGNGEFYQTKDGKINPSVMRGPNRLSKNIDYSGNSQAEAIQLISALLDTYEKEYMQEAGSVNVNSLWDDVK